MVECCSPTLQRLLAPLGGVLPSHGAGRLCHVDDQRPRVSEANWHGPQKEEEPSLGYGSSHGRLGSSPPASSLHAFNALTGSRPFKGHIPSNVNTRKHFDLFNVSSLKF